MLPARSAVLNGPGWTYEHPDSIAADVETFAYDTAGNMVRADNGDAHVGRGYFANGKLRGDTIAVRAYGSTTFDSTPITYEYDLAGAVTKIRHGLRSGAAGTPDSIQYVYEPGTGHLLDVIDPGGTTIGYTYDDAGRQTAVTFPGPIVDVYAWDADFAPALTRDGHAAARREGEARPAERRYVGWIVRLPVLVARLPPVHAEGGRQQRRAVVGLHARPARQCPPCRRQRHEPGREVRERQ